MPTIVSRHRKATRSTCCAFTLTELVVVTVAIGLLIAIVEPSLEAARQRSKLSTCLDRLRAIGEATTAYTAADPSGWALPVHPAQFMQDRTDPTFLGAYEWGGKSGIGRHDFVPEYAGTPLGSKYGTAAGFGPATRPLNKFLYPHGFRDNGRAGAGFNRIGAVFDTQLQLDKYRCPTDDGPPGGAHCPDWVDNPSRSSFDHFGNSYAANLFMITAGTGEMRSNSPYLRPATRIPSPARVINYEENIGRWAWACRREQDACQWIGQGVDPGPTKAVRGWHGKDWIFNRAFVDAHAERQKAYIEGTGDADGYALHYVSELLSAYPLWPGCSDQGGDQPGSFDQYRCIIVRGPGWQKDTMPLPLICTGLHWPGPGRPSYEDCVQTDYVGASQSPTLPNGKQR